MEIHQSRLGLGEMERAELLRERRPIHTSRATWEQKDVKPKETGAVV